MPENSKPEDPGAVWRDQPAENLPINLNTMVNRRTGELWSRTRSEILASLGSALFFVAVAAWRLQLMRDRFVQGAVAAGMAWILVSLYWFRHRIWHKDPSPGLAATGLEHYRRELELRRDHLRNAWLWHGPLVLACATLAAVIMGSAFKERLPAMLPFLAVLALSIGLDIRRRRRQASQLQREIDEIGG